MVGTTPLMEVCEKSPIAFGSRGNRSHVVERALAARAEIAQGEESGVAFQQVRNAQRPTQHPAPAVIVEIRLWHRLAAQREWLGIGIRALPLERDIAMYALAAAIRAIADESAIAARPRRWPPGPPNPPPPRPPRIRRHRHGRHRIHHHPVHRAHRQQDLLECLGCRRAALQRPPPISPPGAACIPNTGPRSPKSSWPDCSPLLSDPFTRKASLAFADGAAPASCGAAAAI